MTETTYIRTKSVGPGKVFGTYYYVTGGSPGVIKTNKGSKYYKYSHLGFNTPSYSRRKKEGLLLPFTPWTQKEWSSTADMSWSGSRSGISQYTVGNANDCSDALGDITTPNSVRGYVGASAFDTQPYVDGAAAKLYSRGWDTATFLAELHKTYQMFRWFGGNLAALLREYATVKKTAQVTLNAWLEGRYGWRILVYDMIDISRALNGLDALQRDRNKDRSGHSFSYENFIHVPDFHWAHGWHTVVLKDTYQVSLRGTVIADLKPPRFRFNPITTAWELIPFSFVLDWFIGVGNWLESLSFLQFSSNHVAAGGVHITCQRSLESHSYVFLDDDGFGPWTGSYSMSVNGFGSWTVRAPSSVSNFPHFRILLDGFKVFDLIALVRQILWR